MLRVPLRSSSSILLHELHWLPVNFRIEFKLACLTYKAFNTSTPPYLQSLLTPYIPPRCLRSSTRPTGLLAEPRCRTVLGSRAFHVSAPPEWNQGAVHKVRTLGGRGSRKNVCLRMGVAQKKYVRRDKKIMMWITSYLLSCRIITNILFYNVNKIS